MFLVVYRSRKLRPIIVDPGLYLMEKTGMFYATQKRELPNAFRLFTGLAFNIYAHRCFDCFPVYSVLMIV